MREFGTISAAFWTRGSGKRLRGHALAQAVAAYVSTCSHANMIGLYYLAIPTIAHEMGHPAEDVRAALAKMEEVGFAFYDEENEIVFIPNAAAHQLGETLKPKDRRVEGVVRQLRSVGKHPFVGRFLAIYGEAFGLTDKGLPTVTEGACKGLQELAEGAPARACASDPLPSDPDLIPEGVQGEPSTPAPGPPSRPSGIRPLADPAGEFEIGEAWREGVAVGSGSRPAKPMGAELRKLCEMVYEHVPPGGGIEGQRARAAWARDLGARYGAAHKADTRNVHRFVDWVGSGCPLAVPRAGPVRAVQPVAKGGRGWQEGDGT